VSNGDSVLHLGGAVDVRSADRPRNDLPARFVAARKAVNFFTIVESSLARRVWKNYTKRPMASAVAHHSM
jgi:hypothetical protein